MIDAGFVPFESAGSAVSFHATDGHGGSIAFHRPHPDVTVFPVVLRSWGRRMGRWFGWREGGFEGR
jgi:hypothetical protein